MINSELFNFLKQRKNDDGGCPNGYMHFPEYNTEYFKQLTAEQLVTRIVKGYPKRIWQKIRDRNEALDCRVYARAAAIALGIDRWSDEKWERLPGSVSSKVERQPHFEGAPDIAATKISSRTIRRIVRSSMM
jgi:phage terminase large subunit GpA-like protein